MSSPTLGVGMVGFGFIGKVHAFAHRSLPLFYDPLPARTRLVSVCTSGPETAAAAQQQAGFERVATDPAALLADPDIDLVHVCTPNDAHFDFLKAALTAGKHVYCDKPLTRTLAEAQEIATLAQTASGVARMTFNCRFFPATLRARELVEEGFLGEVYHFRGEYLHAGYLDPKRPRTWRTRMDRSGGGAIMDLGVHIFDLVRHLVGELDSVSAQLETRIPERPDVVTGEPAPVDVDDIAIVQCRARSGAVGVIEASRLATGVQDELRFEIHGSRGALSFNLMDPSWLTVYDARNAEGPLGAGRGPQRIECVARYPKPYTLGVTKNAVGWPQSHIHCLFEAIRAMASGDRSGGPGIEDGLAAQRFVDACQRSAKAREWVTI